MQDYDAVVTGAGLGGLSSGAFLAACPHKDLEDYSNKLLA